MCIRDSHGGVRGEQIRHQAFMGRIKVQDQYERHSVIGGKRGKQFLAGIEPTGRSADADDVELPGPARGRSRLQGTPP